jgi:hypothetical protein
MRSSPYRFLLRMPQHLRDPLRDAAERSGRSLNAEIVARLEASVAGEPARRTVRPRRLVPAIAAAAVLALAASGAALQLRADTTPDDSTAGSFPPPKRVLVTEQYAPLR